MRAPKRHATTFVVFVAAFLLLFAPGCSSLNSGNVKTLKQIEMDVSWPMTRYRNGVAAGAVTLGEQQQVNAAYNSYTAAYQQALQAAQNNKNAPAPDNVKSLADQVISAIAAIPF